VSGGRFSVVVEALLRRDDMMRMVALMVGVLLGGAVFGAVLLPEGKEASAQEVAERPNFVFIMTDDLDERSMAQLGGIRTIMGSNGTTFENAYVTYSLCCPSRATFLRGQYPHNHQIIGSSSSTGGGAGKFRNLGLDQSTVATWLNDADYQTKYIGKYMNSYGGTYVPPGWDEWYVNIGPAPTTRVNQDGQEIVSSGHSTDVFAGKAEDFIRRSSVKPDPFFLVVGTSAPHEPPEVAERHQNSFVDTPLPRPPNFDEADISDKPKYMQSFPRLSSTKITVLHNHYRKRLRAMLSVEDLLTQVIATLEQTDELSNTYVFFTSDNGYHLGHHRFELGKKTPYEEDIGVPLMVRGPAVPAGAIRQQLVINNDFAPTMADLAGVSIPAFVDGRSFASLLTARPPSSWRQAFLEENWFLKGMIEHTPTHKGVHTQDHMFVEYDTGEHELYDLALDPYQLQSRPRAGNELLYSDLGARLNNLRDCSGDGCRAAEWALSPLPETTIDSGPSGYVNTTSASFAFSASMLGSTFECSLDEGPFGVCDSPEGYAHLAEGSHTFRVRATDGAGNAEPTPASRTWVVVKCTIVGTSSAETLTGTSADDVICAGAGNDTLNGLEGNDVLKGEGGADQLYGEIGDDHLDGGLGTDTANFSGSVVAISASLTDGTASGEGSDTFSGIEKLIGTNQADALRGSATNDTIDGAGAADSINGLGGADTLKGAGGGDTLKGAGGGDTLDSRDGVEGNDTLDGEVGTDTCMTDATEKSILNCEQ
jgi:N-acetylglucosamine-6-sulfatase